MRKNCLTLVVLLVVGMLTCSAVWAETGHYPLGSEGIKAATLPPPGLYLKNYISYYSSNDSKGSDGSADGASVDVEALAVVPRLIWMTDTEILGAQYGMDALVPFIYTDVEIGAANIKDNDFCYGDMFVEPIDLAWHGERYDAATAFGIWIPTGKYDKNNPATPGKDFWTYMFTLGATYYLDEEKTLSASALSRYEIHSEKDHSDVQPGRNLVLEWGVGKAVNPTTEVGVAGYAQWQITDDSGKDVTWDKSVHDRVAAVGPEVTMMLPDVKWFISLRSMCEFATVDRSDGVTTTLTLIKIF